MPACWSHHAQLKRWHFAAAAQLRKSRDDLANKRYGDELGRLFLAKQYVSCASAVPTRGLPTQALVEDLASLQRMLETNLARAEKDNQLIYLEATTAPPALPDIGTALMVKDAVPTEVQSPVSWLRDKGELLWFARLVTYGVDVAVRLYNDQKQQWLHTLERRQAELDTSMYERLTALHAASTLSRFEHTRQPPASWNAYAKDIGSGMAAVECVMRDSAATRELCCDVLYNTETIVFRARPDLLPEAVDEQHHLQTQWRDYQRTLAQAAESDATVRAAWEKHAPLLKALSRGTADVMAVLAPCVERLEAVRCDWAPQLRALRSDLEHFDDIAAERRTTVLRACAALENDNLQARLMAVAQERRLADRGGVDPAALADVMENALAAHHGFADELERSAAEQSRSLARFRDALASLLRNVHVADALDAQAQAWAQVDEAYAHWPKLRMHVDEGHAFYMRLWEMLQAFSLACQQTLAPHKAAPSGLVRLGE